MTPIVMDTGVLVSGIFWYREPHACVKAWLHGVVALVLSEAIFTEYERVLREVKIEEGLTINLIPWFETMRRLALWVVPDPIGSQVCRDPNDDKFIEAALAGHSRVVIARDADLTVLEKPFGIDILTPRQFLARLPRHIRRHLERSASL